MDIKLAENQTPLVTFVIFTYNQRDYILEAINGAIAQNYANLEIIISDDCSSDGTFELVKSFVDSYTGPHTLIANQTMENKCTVGHFFDVVDLANGRLLILSAGDDISYPDRVRRIVSVWLSDKAIALFSNYDLIDERGSVLQKNFSPNLRSELAEDIFRKSGQPDIHGASSAYDLDFVKILPRPTERFFFEDTFMTFMLYLHGKKITKIDEALVAYRTHAESLSNSGLVRQSIKLIVDGQRKAEIYTLNKYQLYLFMVDHPARLFDSNNNGNINLFALKKYMSRLEAEGQWIEAGLINRIQSLVRLRHDRKFVIWMIPRLLGIHIFSLLRFIRG
ncbi:MAG: glycosyltransferase [Gallionella sp.]|nr:glycosyltransferase [Gallionella sp.]